MKYRYIPAFVMLLAGLVCCLLSVVQGWPVMSSLVTLAIVLVLFYLIGKIAAQIVGRVHAERLAAEEAERKRIEAEEQARLEREMQEAEEQARLAEERSQAESDVPGDDF